MRTSLVRRLGGGLLSATLSVGACERHDAGWPDVAALDASVFFANGPQAAARFSIVAPEGGALYRLECHGGGYEGDPQFDYSGDFECRLASLYTEDPYSTLFTENPNQSRDWQSRARFLAEELIGACAEYPEYGRIRTFRLRGMRITLGLADITFVLREPSGAEVSSPPALESFRFDLRVEPDGTAGSAIAEPVPYVEPEYAHPDNPGDRSKLCDTVSLHDVPTTRKTR